MIETAPNPPAVLRDALRRQRVAYHEAAHVIAGMVVGDMPVIRAYVTEDGSGQVDHENPFEDCPEEEFALRVVRAVVTLHAGHVFDEQRGHRDWGGSRRDLLTADRILGYLVEHPKREAVDRRLIGVAREIVHDAIEPIENVGAGLYLAGSLSLLGGHVGERHGYCQRRSDRTRADAAASLRKCSLRSSGVANFALNAARAFAVWARMSRPTARLRDRTRCSSRAS